ncbi:MAG: SLC13 family permease [bacterium]|nr:SLC13 family permease [bacterium]
MTPVNLEILLLVGIILFALAAFVREWLPMDVVSLACLGLLLLFGLVTPEEAISGFSNPAVITVMMMFILSAGLVDSGLVTRLAYRISDWTGGGHWKPALLLLLLTGLVSAFLNNTAAVAVLMPVAIHLSRHHRFSPSRLLMPLSFVAIFGGTATLVGTSTNLLVSSLAPQHGLAPFSMFEFLPLGSVLFAIGFVYVALVPMRLLEPRSLASSLTRKYHLDGFLTELKVAPSSKLVNRTVVEEHISERYEMTVLEILRGKKKISAEIRNTPLRVDDVLLVRGAVEDIVAFKEKEGLLLLTDIKLSDADLNDQHTVLAELQLSPVSRLTGDTLREINFRRQYGAFVLALNRTGDLIRDKLASIPLKAWDTLLVFGPKSRVEALSDVEDFISLGERQVRLRLARRWWICAATIPVVVILAAAGIMPILKSAILGTVFLLLTRTITIRQAYRGIDWTVIFLLAAILPLGLAMENTGLAALISSWIEPFGMRYGPHALLSLLYVATTALTSMFSNNATAILMVPIAIGAASNLGVDAKPFLMAIAYGASTSFMTPVGYQTNAMVSGPGAYRFNDFFKFGGPLTLIFWLVATWLIPVFWPFQP